MSQPEAQHHGESTPLSHQHCKVVFQPSGRQGHVAAGTSLLDAARQLGVDIDSICGGRQTCGKCKVLVEQGVFPKYGIESASEHVTPPEAAECDYFARQRTGEL